MPAVSVEPGRGSPLARMNAVLVAPGASSVEAWLSYGAALVGAAFGLVAGAVSESTPLQLVLLVLLGFDLFGGAVVNATAAASRRFHGAQSSRVRRWGFVAAHLHLLGVALMFPDYSWAVAVLLYSVILLAAALILLVNEALRRPVAFAACSVILPLVAVATATGVPAELSWIAPLLVIKLLLGHLVPWVPSKRSETSSRRRCSPVKGDA
ncbi:MULTISPECIES: hypothetical protein [Actinoalloteichus]|uniref:Uncharacterized protein n=1 Tax=Actinoalloteichus fjordicus TaxID=1612552 RepID=A0AAC9PQD1_9PSEU|nr:MULTISPECIES: hypothetical protein [Actinoalloteichus]APU12756.1 hypothetical protein UA74_03375 [Actinoalloteichus fjordicus]APU18727.1 hypothetical protein UA75_03470 [Actinoalloteichus sp. GBA129-24]